MTRNKRIWYALFVFYCIAMAYLLFGRAEAPGGLPYSQQLSMRLNLVPFHTVRRQIALLADFDRPRLIRHALVNLCGNVILFIPLGIFLPKLWASLCRFRTLLPVTALLVTAVELTQLLTLLGRCDIDDLILNLLGTAIGCGLYRRLWNK